MNDQQFNQFQNGNEIYILPPEHRENDSYLELSEEDPHHLRPRPELSSAERQAAEDRHRRKCQICRHPEREQIEEDFLQWRRPWAIGREYGIPEATLFRHAHAFNLFQLRRDNMRLALDRVIEKGVGVENTGDVIIRAVRAQACLTDDNKWVEPGKHVHITTETLTPTQTPSPRLP